MNTRILVAYIAILLYCTQFGAAAEAEKSSSRNQTTNNQLRSGIAVNRSLELQRDALDYETFTFKMPEYAFGFIVTLTSEDADLDLFIKYDEEANMYEYSDAYSDSDNFNEKLVITRFGNPTAQSGLWYIDVVFQHTRLPVKQGRILNTVTYSVQVDLIPLSPENIQSGQSLSFTLRPDSGMIKYYSLEVPEGTRAIRLDAFNTDADIDFLASWSTTLFDFSNADYVAESMTGRETLLIIDQTTPAVQQGTLFIAVIDHSDSEYPVDGSISVSFSTDPPQHLLRYPVLPLATTDVGKAVSATVGITSESVTGSGCLVSADGYILTNYHVVEGTDQKPSPLVAVSLTIGEDRPPVEMFKARVEYFDKELDLALLKIVSGYYGQPLPQNMRFPFFRLGDDRQLQLGEELVFLGFPGIGGSGSRTSVTFSRGVVSGFERLNIGRLVKTDAEINSGSSGGPALDDTWRLIGLATSIIGEDSGQIAYIHPVSLIPENWKLLFTPR